MKKILAGLFLTFAFVFSSNALADRDGHWRHEGRGGNPLGWFLGGIVLGEVVGQQIGSETPPPNTILVCEDVALYDSYGIYYRTERHCHYEYIR
jgi:hypothetical protein